MGIEYTYVKYKQGEEADRVTVYAPDPDTAYEIAYAKLKPGFGEVIRAIQN